VDYGRTNTSRCRAAAGYDGSHMFADQVSVQGRSEEGACLGLQQHELLRQRRNGLRDPVLASRAACPGELAGGGASQKWLDLPIRLCKDYGDSIGPGASEEL